MIDLQVPGLLIINGNCGEGKSNLIKFLIRKYKNKFDYGVVFTNTSFDVNDSSAIDYLPKEFIHSEYKEEILEGLMNIQKDVVERGGLNEAFVIFDDCIDKKIFASTLFTRLATQFRHYHITPIISTQYPNLVPPTLRSNIMSTVIFKSTSKRAIDALWESYGQDYSKEDFRKFLCKGTGDYNFIYYNKKEKKEKQYQILKVPNQNKKFMLKYNTTLRTNGSS